MLKVRAMSIEHLEGVLERLGLHGEMRTSVVLSTQYADRPVEPPGEDFARPTVSTGWTLNPACEAATRLRRRKR
jgi:Lrp/AsnC family transcriptional regulator, leucine-responsive regulatory protein